jgi:primosomal protein N' (replication factor Y)
MEQPRLFSDTPIAYYADVILPLALPQYYTYGLPAEYVAVARVGMRVEVQFGKNRLYAALVRRIHTDRPKYGTKTILSVLDAEAIVGETQLRFWEWVASYYCCTVGEVMNAALPSGLKLTSETRLHLSPLFDGDLSNLTDDEYLITEALTIRNELTMEEVQKILNHRATYAVINALLFKRVVRLKEELQNKYKPLTADFVQLAEPYRSDETTLQYAFDKVVNRSLRQAETLMALIQLLRQNPQVRKSELLTAANASPDTIKKLVEKKIIVLEKHPISRLNSYTNPVNENDELSITQQQTLASLHHAFDSHPTVLLHGITGSGKTQIYIELIKKALANNHQVLYLLPEIALTNQLTRRLQKVFGDDLVVYHSRLNNNERVELWQHIRNHTKKIVLGARSALFLPFAHLALIVIDEEHDPSFKQQEPAPRYHARDAAIYLATQIHNAQVLLGSATPSIETYANTQNNKYGLVTLSQRFGTAVLPSVQVVNIADEHKRKAMQSHFSPQLLTAIRQTLEQKKQIILFQNRRGYAPAYVCAACQHAIQCIHCDVSLTHHKSTNNLRCHYCGYNTTLPPKCPACGLPNLQLKGFGTEKVEDELRELIPQARIARMDWDTVSTKDGLQQLIANFEDHKIDLLIGTQMVTKGLDFDNVHLVGILSADSLLQYPDFRASEQAFQLMTQVSGRAGRKHTPGQVIIQAYNTTHPVLAETIANNYTAFYTREIAERHQFHYPPFYRLISLQFQHPQQKTVAEAATFFANHLKTLINPTHILGPTTPTIPRIRTQYIQIILIKIPRQNTLLHQTKQAILDTQVHLAGQKGMTTVRINIDVDPH